MTDGARATTTKEAVEVKIEVDPENVPLPTDSMITVRLSDAELAIEPAQLEEMVEDGEVQSSGQTAHTSTVSSLSGVSSRPSSRSSQASSTSNSVDWEGLEKTEEQEVKDDATDEVGLCPSIAVPNTNL